MRTICLIVAIILFVLVGLKVEPAATHSIDLLGFGLAFFAAAFLPYESWRLP